MRKLFLNRRAKIATVYAPVTREYHFSYVK